MLLKRHFFPSPINLLCYPWNHFLAHRLLNFHHSRWCRSVELRAHTIEWMKCGVPVCTAPIAFNVVTTSPAQLCSLLPSKVLPWCLFTPLVALNYIPRCHPEAPILWWGYIFFEVSESPLFTTPRDKNIQTYMPWSRVVCNEKNWFLLECVCQILLQEGTFRILCGMSESYIEVDCRQIKLVWVA